MARLFYPPNGIVNNAGGFVNAVPRVVRVVGPAAYAAGGVPVDCSAFFSSIVAVECSRRFVTATGISSLTRFLMPSENGADLYSSAKFRVLVLAASDHSHFYDKADALTGNQNALSAVGVANHQHANTYTATSSGAPSSYDFIEFVGFNEAANTYEMIVWGVPK